MISWGVSAPCPADLIAEAAGGLVVVAESVRDDGCGKFEELLPHGGAAGGRSRDPGLVQERGQVVGAGRLPRPATREEPAGRGVGGSWLRYQLSGINAAIGLAQLDHFDTTVETRRGLWCTYRTPWARWRA